MKEVSFAAPIIATAMIWAVPVAAAAATVRDARVAVVFSPGACDVTSRLVVETAEPVVVDHRLMVADGRRPPVFAVTGALAGQAETIGRTASLRISLTGAGRNEYLVRYRVASPAARMERCPLLVPSAPTDGVTRAVTIDVSVPPGTTRLPGEFPAFHWGESSGRISLGHIPAFVRVPLAPAGAPVTWRDALDVRRGVDVAAVVVIVIASLGWAALQKPRA